MIGKNLSEFRNLGIHVKLNVQSSLVEKLT